MTLICSRGDGSRVREGLPSRHSGTPARPPHTNLRARRVDCGVERPRDLESCSSAFTSLVIACRSASPACMADGDAGRLEQAFDDVASMLDERLLRAADCAQAGRCVTACDDIECARRVSHRCRLVTLNDIQHVKFAVCIVTTRSPTPCVRAEPRLPLTRNLRTSVQRHRDSGTGPFGHVVQFANVLALRRRC